MNANEEREECQLIAKTLKKHLPKLTLKETWSQDGLAEHLNFFWDRDAQPSSENRVAATRWRKEDDAVSRTITILRTGRHNRESWEKYL